MLKRFAALLSASLMLVACGICRKGTNTTESQRETVKVMEHIKIVPVITKIEIPPLSIERETRDTSSHLENQYAESDARVSRDGILYHSLKTKPQTLQQQHEVPVEYRDSIVVREVEKKVEVERLVEKKLNAWQKFRLDIFWPLIALLAIAGRKQMLWVVKKILALLA